MEIVRKVFFWVPVTIFLLVLMMIGIPFAWFNDMRLSRFSANVFRHSLPPGTTVLSSESRFGLLFANGNHCDYWVSMTMVTRSPREAVLAHYQDTTFPAAWYTSPSAKNGRIPVRVSTNEVNAEGALEYEIDVIDAGYPAGMDLRCH